MAGFSINIGANTAQVTKSLHDLQQDLIAFRNQLKVATDSQTIVRLNQEIAKIETSMKGILSAGSFRTFSSGVNAASSTVLDFSRVIQDLPYGLQGITNNITQIPDTLQRLSAAAKESGKSIGSLLLSSVTGFGGIGLAISAITSGILIYNNGIAGFNRKNKEAKEELDKLTKALKEAKTASEVSFEGIGSSQAQILQVQSLAAAIQNETRSISERKNALDQLKSINKEYFGDLKLQEGSLRSLTTITQEYTNAIVQQAVVSELKSEIGKLGAELFKQAQKVKDARDAVEAYKKSLNIPAVDSLGNRTFILDRTLDSLNATLRKEEAILSPIADKYNDLAKGLESATIASLKFKSLTGSGGGEKEDPILKSLKKELSGYQKQLESTNKSREAGLLATFQENDALALQLKILETMNAIDAREVAIKAKPKLEIDPVLNELEIKQAYQQAATRSGKPIEIPLLIAPKVKIDVRSRTGSEAIEQGAFDSVINDVLKTARQKLEFSGLQVMADLSGSIRQIIQSGAVEMVVGLGEGLGEALASGDMAGGLRKAGQNMLGVLGSVMQQIGREVIAAAIKIKLLKEALRVWAVKNPALAIVAGIGLVAAGAALRNIKFDGPKFANGGIVTGPVIGQVGEMHRPEVIMPLDRLPQMLAQVGGGNGGSGWQMIPIVNNDGLYLAVRRGERSVNRKF